MGTDKYAYAISKVWFWETETLKPHGITFKDKWERESPPQYVIYKYRYVSPSVTVTSCRAITVTIVIIVIIKYLYL